MEMNMKSSLEDIKMHMNKIILKMKTIRLTIKTSWIQWKRMQIQLKLNKRHLRNQLILIDQSDFAIDFECCHFMEKTWIFCIKQNFVRWNVVLIMFNETQMKTKHLISI